MKRTLTFDLPEGAWALIDSMGERWHIPAEPLAHMLLLSGLAEQIRFVNDEGSKIADQLLAFTAHIGEQAGADILKLQVPEEVKNIMMYEVAHAEGRS